MNIVVFSKSGCPFCSLLKMELGKRGYTYSEVDLTDEVIRKDFYARTGTSTVPQVLLTDGGPSVDNLTGRFVGGYSEVSANWGVLDFVE